MNILLINHYAGSVLHGMEFRPYYLAREWIKAGHEVTIVAADYSHLRHKNPSIKKSYTLEVVDSINYLWFRTPSYSGNGIKRVLSMFSFISQLALYSKRLVKDFSPDVVIASSTYPLDIHAANIIAKKSRAKLLFEVHDLWPLTPMEIGGMSAKHPFIMLLQHAENKAYRLSDQVVSMLPCAKEYMISKGLSEMKYNHIPNGVVVDDWNIVPALMPELHTKTFNDLKKSGCFIFGYTGGHALSNALDTIINAAKYLGNENIKIVLVGDGVEKNRLKSLAIQHKLSNVVFLPPVPKNAIPVVIAFFDCALITWKKSSLYRFGVSPNKVFDYMMAGLPIIQAIEAGNDMVKESGAGLSVVPNSPKTLSIAMKKMNVIPQIQRDKMGALGKDFVLNNHDYKKLSADFINIMNKKN